MPYNVDSLAKQMGLHEIEINSRKSLFGITSKDVSTLTTAKLLIEANVDDIVKRFYQIQLSNSDIALIIGDAETLSRLKQAQHQYIRSLFSGEYGVEYVNNRLRIGKVHKRIGVEPKHYLSSMKQLQDLLVETLKQHLETDLQEAVISALDRLLAFDIALVFETYTLSLTSELENSRAKVEDYARDLEKIIAERTEELAQLSLIDPLTELPNRRAMTEHSKRQFSNSSRYNQPVSIAYIDVDNFKQLNDTQGHAKGDELLILLAKILRDNVREGDLACRLGGDEFAVLIQNCDHDNARLFAERLVQQYNERVPAEWQTSISVGLHTHNPDEPSSEEDCLKKADAAMYQAKQKQGCTIVEFASHPRVLQNSNDAPADPVTQAK